MNVMNVIKNKQNYLLLINLKSYVHPNIHLNSLSFTCNIVNVRPGLKQLLGIYVYNDSIVLYSQLYKITSKY